jgi:hypothetical protein
MVLVIASVGGAAADSSMFVDVLDVLADVGKNVAKSSAGVVEVRKKSRVARALAG